MDTDTHSQPEQAQQALHLDSLNAQQLANLCGHLNDHIRQIEQRLAVTIRNRANRFHIIGDDNRRVGRASRLLKALGREAQRDIDISPDAIHLLLQDVGIDSAEDGADDSGNGSVEPITLIHTKRATVKPRGKSQQGYVRAIQQHDINFGIGPAGTGKTYLAVACAVQALQEERVRRILLVRPAVEAGEKLGFLPGDLSQKIDPYLRPLYDALYEMMGFETVNKLIERNVIEVAPLAFMRGRTLNHAFIILDESQNTTKEQMKMFLTRIGFGSTAVITGDVTQIDLPRGTQSGLTQSAKVLDNIDAISFTYFQSRDVVRHPLVQRIVDAYDHHENDATTLDSNLADKK